MKDNSLDSRRISLIIVFSVISIVLDLLVTPGFSSGVWFGWIFIMSPISGIILGPRDGFIATLISVMIGHSIVFRESVFEFIFTIGAPIGSAVTGLIFKGERGKILVYYTVLLAAYFLTPIARQLPIWGMWDVYVAYLVLLFLFFLERRDLDFMSNSRMAVIISTLIGLEADILFRIFVLIPAQGYSIFYGLSSEVLIMIWSVPAPLITPFKVGVSVFLATLLVPSILKVLKENGIELVYS
jgi:hypothetical protein